MKTRLMLTLLVVLPLLLASGCATKSKALTDEEIISQRIQEGINDIKAKNWDKFNGNVSEKFESYAVGDKEDLLAYLKNAEDMGFLDGIEIDVSEAEIKVEGDTATMDPIYASGSFGSLTLTFEGTKENGVWVITSVEPGF